MSIQLCDINKYNNTSKCQSRDPIWISPNPVFYFLYLRAHPLCMAWLGAHTLNVRFSGLSLSFKKLFEGERHSRRDHGQATLLLSPLSPDGRAAREQMEMRERWRSWRDGHTSRRLESCSQVDFSPLPHPPPSTPASHPEGQKNVSHTIVSFVVVVFGVFFNYV
jgi:hypothetical protein